MRQLLILSGKGGTGKTTVAGAFIRLSGATAYGDCDVDAPNLHLVLERSDPPATEPFFGMPKAVIDPAACTACDGCRFHCGFGAIQIHGRATYSVDPVACEGCAVCEAVCPAGAVELCEAVSGTLYLYGGERVFSTAELSMGSGNSGKLVSAVKQKLKEAAESRPFAIIDGSPGIGCPVIASLSGVDMVLIVAEPSVSGISDMERVLRTAAHFNVPAAVCVNKFDTNPQRTEEIVGYCQRHNLPYVGSIPYDPEAIRAVNNGISIADVTCSSGKAVIGVYDRTMTLVNQIGATNHE